MLVSIDEYQLREAIHTKIATKKVAIKTILMFLPWQIYSKVKYKKRTLKKVKIQQ